MKILITGNLGSGKSHLGFLAKQALPPFTYHAIDDYRRVWGDGSMEKEAVARAAFLRDIAAKGPMIIECTGLGDLGIEVRDALRTSHLLVICLEVELRICLERLKKRSWDVPYPGTPAGAIELCRRSQGHFEAGEIFIQFEPIAPDSVIAFPHVSPAHSQAIISFITKWIHKNETV